MGFLRKRHWNAKRRVKGRNGKPHREGDSAFGKPLCSIQDFLRWAIEGRVYSTMYYAWIESGRKRAMTPTIDRIDPRRGYEIDNLQWLTLSQNSRKGTFEGSGPKRNSSYRGVEKEGNRFVAKISINGKKTRLGSFGTELEAALCYLRHAKRVYAGLGLPPEAFELPTTPQPQP